MVGTVAKGVAISSAAVLIPYAVAAGGAVLPELFAIIGPKAESFLVQGTVKAFVNASAQKITSGNVDWIDVALQYVPGASTKIGKAALVAAEASFDYDKDGFSSIFDTKEASAALVDAMAIGFVDKVFGNFNKALADAFKTKGLKGESLTNAIGAVIKSQTEFLKEAIETALADEAKNRLKLKK